MPQSYPIIPKNVYNSVLLLYYNVYQIHTTIIQLLTRIYFIAGQASEILSVTIVTFLYPYIYKFVKNIDI